MFFIISDKFFIILKEFWHEWFMLLFVNNLLRLFDNNPLRISPKGMKLCHTLILQIFCNNQTTKLAIVQLRDKVEEIKKKYKNMGLGRSRFRVITLWREGSQFIFSIKQIPYQKLLCQTVANIDVKLFHIVTHSYVASFWIKTSFVKLKHFLVLRKPKKRRNQCVNLKVNQK